MRGLTPPFPATLFIVLHIPEDSPSLMPELLSRVGFLPVTHPLDAEEIQQEQVNLVDLVRRVIEQQPQQILAEHEMQHHARACTATRRRIWIESTPGKGSTFFFSLPLHHKDKEAS